MRNRQRIETGTTAMAAKMMRMRAYRTELEPTVEQRRAMSRQAGAARWAYNWGLAEWRRQQAAREAEVASRLRRLRHLVVRMAAHRSRDSSVLSTSRAWLRVLLPRWRLRYLRAIPSPSWMAIHKQLTQVKRAPETAWLQEISAYVVREALADLGDAHKHFFRRLKEGQRGRAAGEPQFRSRKDPSGRGFRIAQPIAIAIDDRRVKIAGVGWVRLKERGYLPAGANARGLACREIAGRWYVAVQVEEAAPPTRELEQGRRVGVELGVRSLVVTSDGQHVGGIRDLAGLPSLDRRLALWQRRMARRWRAGISTKEQSRGWHEAVRRVQSLHGDIANLRRDVLHQTSTRIVRAARAPELVVRDMQVQRMIGRAGKQTRREQRARNAIAPMMARVGFYEIRRQLEYKQGWAGGTVTVTPTEYPSTRACSQCGVVRDADPGYPEFRCDACGTRLDREANSARNLRDFTGGGSSPDGETGGRAARRKTPHGAQRPAEPGSPGGGGNLAASGPDGAETSALGSGNQAPGDCSPGGTGAASAATQLDGGNLPHPSPSTDRSSASSEVVRMSQARESEGLGDTEQGPKRTARNGRRKRA